jgi:hypothetical protein
MRRIIFTGIFTGMSTPLRHLNNVFGVGVGDVGGQLLLVQPPGLEERVPRRHVRKAVRNVHYVCPLLGYSCKEGNFKSPKEIS